MTTYRERREAKADRLRTWADSRDSKAEVAHSAAQRTADMIPFGQPIMVGHYSESGDRNRRARMRTNYDKSLEHSNKAAEFRSRADGIEQAARNAVYSDDTDAIERLEVRIAGREAERDRVKAFNASARKGEPDMSLLTEKEQEKILSIAKVASYQLGKGGAFPGYHLSNLGATIRKDKQRLEALTAAREQTMEGGDVRHD